MIIVRIFSLFTVALLLNLPAIAQDQPLVSTTADSIKIQAMIDAAKSYKLDGEYLKAGELYTRVADFYFKYQEWPNHVRTLASAADNYRRLGNFRIAEELVNDAIATAMKHLGPLNPSLANAYHTLGIIKDYQGEYDNAIKINNQALAIYLKLEDRRPMAIANIYNSLGVNYLHKSDSYRSIENLQNALKIFTQELDPRDQRIADLYLNMGGTYLNMGKYDLAREYFEQEMSITIRNMGPSHPYVGETCNNLGTVHAYLSNFKESEEYFLRSLNIFTKLFGDRDYRNIDVYHNLGLLYSDIGNFDMALYYFNQLEETILTHLDAKNIEMGKLYLSSSLNSLDMGAPQQAHAEAFKALEIFSIHLGERNPLVAKCYLALARSARDEEKVDQALQYCQKGLIANSAEFSAMAIEANPSNLHSLSHKDFLRLMEIKAGLWNAKYSESKDITHLKLAFNTLQLADELIAIIQQAQLSFADKLHHASETDEIYQLGVEVAYTLFELSNDRLYLEEALNFSDRSKASVLRAAFAADYAEEFGNIPKDLLRLEAKITADRNLFQNRSQEEKAKGIKMDTSMVNDLQGQLFHINRTHDSLVLAFEAQFPKYVELKYRQVPINLEELQSSIDEGTVLEYFYNDDDLYCFVVTQDQFQVVSTPITPDFVDLIEAFREQINTRSEEVVASGEKLYQILIAPLKDDIIPGERLTIIPHGILALLPYDVLSDDHGDGSSSARYLIEDHPISYRFSVNTLKENISTQASGNARFAGFAPSYGPDLLAQAQELEPYGTLRNSLGALPYSNDEISLAASHFSEALTFSGQEASESRFKSTCSEYDILHLALHAVADQTDPLKSKLIFSNLASDSLEDGFLTAREIYNLKLNADMAILSACNTAFGKLAGGEGVMSLGRAFAFAGCPSVVMSLWPAQDQSTAKLMGYFYEQLANGQSKDQALRQAKLTYLKHADDLVSHPFFWANFIVQGNIDPISKPRNSFLWVIAVLSITLIIVVIVFKRRNSLNIG